MLQEDSPGQIALNILIADYRTADRIVARDQISRYFEKNPHPKYGSRINFFYAGKDGDVEVGTRLLHEENIDIVISDVNFDPLHPEDKRGLACLLRETRSLDNGSRIPFLCWAEPEYECPAKNAGVDKFIPKNEYLSLPKAIEASIQ